MLGSCRLNTNTGIKKATDTAARILATILIFVNADALSSGYLRSGIAALIFEIPIGSIYDKPCVSSTTQTAAIGDNAV
jgi:hypothetical protein